MILFRLWFDFYIPLNIYVSSSMIIIASNLGSRHSAEFLLDDLTDGAICFDAT
jgi:hypothetical protein